MNSRNVNVSSGTVTLRTHKPRDFGDPQQFEPTWRDVFRAMHHAGYQLKIEERNGSYRKWIVPTGTMGEVAWIMRETLGGRASWTVELYGYGSYSVRLNNPPPSDVLDAARLVKLIGRKDDTGA